MLASTPLKHSTRFWFPLLALFIFVGTCVAQSSQQKALISIFAK
jgi:hypothetical protein